MNSSSAGGDAVNVELDDLPTREGASKHVQAGLISPNIAELLSDHGSVGNIEANVAGGEVVRGITSSAFYSGTSSNRMLIRYTNYSLIRQGVDHE